MKIISLFFAIVACLGFKTEQSNTKVMNIVIDRQYETDKCIQGYLFVDGKPICYTMELPWKNNKSNISAIPKGTYDAILRYDKSDGWRIQLKNVPKRTYIQIHIGNYTSQIQGCTLVGMSVDTDNCSIHSSKKAYSKLKTAFYGSSNPNSTPNKVIKVTYK